MKKSIMVTLTAFLFLGCSSLIIDFAKYSLTAECAGTDRTALFKELKQTLIDEGFQIVYYDKEDNIIQASTPQIPVPVGDALRAFHWNIIITNSKLRAYCYSTQTDLTNPRYMNSTTDKDFSKYWAVRRILEKHTKDYKELTNQ